MYHWYWTNFDVMEYLEGIRIARLGYPKQSTFVEFRQRYEVLTPGTHT